MALVLQYTVPYFEIKISDVTILEHQRTDESSPTSGSEESEEDTKAKEKVIDHMSHPREKLAQSQKKIAQLIKGKKVN